MLARKPRTDHADTLYALLRLHAPRLLDGCEREHRFHHQRRWRFDLAWPVARLAVEVNGGRYAHAGGRHASDRDYEKLQQAAALGWRVMPFSPQQLDRNPLGCIAVIRLALQQEPTR